MKKRVARNLGLASILLLLSAIIMLTASEIPGPTPAADVAPNGEQTVMKPISEMSDEELEDFFELKQAAIAAHEEFQELMWDDELGDCLYPDTFAGAYLNQETCKLCVALTDCSDEVKAEYNTYFSDPSVITYVEAKYSYNDLLELQKEIESAYDNCVSIGISQKKNVVRAGFSDEATVQRISDMAVRSTMPVEVYYTEPAIAYTNELLLGG